MFKFLLTLLVVVIGVKLWLGRHQRPAAGRRTPAAPPPPQPMVACERCGVHLPRADAFIDDRGQLFCGPEHRRLGASRRPSR